MGTPSASPVPAPHPVTVRGGAGGIVARGEEIAALGRRFGDAALESLHASLDLHAYLAHPAIVASAVLDPAGYATFETDLLTALDGLHGLSAVGVQSGALDTELRAAALAYESTDAVVTRLHDEVRGLLTSPADTVVIANTLRRTHDPLAALQAGASADPGALDAIADLLGVPALIAKVAAGIPDGSGAVTDLGLDTAGAAGRPPRALRDIVRGLARRDESELSGAVDVRIITLADGSRRVIVDITGTRSWSLHPGSEVADAATNGRVLTGQHSAYEQGVLRALHRAGVRPSDDVMLVGHSQGGLVAVTTARDAVRSKRYNVTHVITVGSPIGLTVGQVPSTVKVLALENSRDVVPHLDGRANPNRPNVTTVTSARGDGTIIGDHSIERSYVPVANDAEHSGNASVDDFLTSADGYLRGTHVSTHTYEITRRP